MLPFSVDHTDPSTSARAGRLTTPHGVVRTPAFMPVGTAGTVKGLAAWELERMGPEMVLANAYHLLLRPGEDRLRTLGGLHRLMAWDGPILTDSGGFQVCSLARWRSVDDGGVTFRSHLDGETVRLTPRQVVGFQANVGVDVAMVLDQCLAFPAERRQAEDAVQRGLKWAAEGLEEAELRRGTGAWEGGVFAIQQGSLELELRRRCTEELSALPFDGFAVGGLAVGEPTALLRDAVEGFGPLLPAHRPRYLMGVGYPEDILHAVACGLDLFDCVLPTRSARTGKVFTSRGDLAIKNARHADDPRPLDEGCGCPTCATYSRGALRHLFASREVTSSVLLTVHNVFFFLNLMRAAREAIMSGRYAEFRATVEDARKVGAE